MHACASLQPDASTSTTNDRDQEYPALLRTEPSSNKVKSDGLLPSYHRAKITEIVEIPCEQRRYQSDSSQAAGRVYDAQSRICSEIVKETGVDINLTCSKTNTLTIVLSGQPDKVALAKRSLITELQQQESVKLNVPQEFHGFLIGKKGEKLRDLQSKTMTRITIPSSNAPDPNTIVISGPKQGIAEAEHFIKETVARQAQQGFERLDIPKVYHPFIFGPNGKTLDELRARTETKVNVPPPAVQASVITITGKREGVAQAAAELQRIHEEAKQYKTIPVRVRKSQHRLVFGPRGSGLAEILAETGVSVELPTDATSEEIILRGRPEALGRALSMVYERAESSISEEVDCPNRFHKLLIGKRGATLNELLSGYERVHIEFGENRDKILLEGPPEEVGIIMEKLKARIAELEATVAMEKIRVDPKYFRHIIGRQGATILKFRGNKVQIRLPTLEKGDHLAADEIVIEGDPQEVERAKKEILSLVEKLENEKCKDMIIEPRIQQLLCTGYRGVAPPIRAIYDAFPKVSVLWPDNQGMDDHTAPSDSAGRSVVQLRGDRQQVDAAAERLQKLIKQVIEENHRQEIRIFKEFRPHIFGRGSTKIQKLLDDTKTRIQYPNPSDGSDVFTIIGREENVQQAIRQLEDLQKKLANVKEIIVSIPSALTTKFVGDQAPSLRSIREQCAGVHMRFVNPPQKHDRKGNQVEVMVIGPPEEVQRAQKLLDQLSAKVAQLCAEELVHVDPKFHGFLIGREGINITRFRERHNVELLFPDRMETDPKLSMEIRILGPKDAVAQAKTDLEAMIKTLEDEIEQAVPVDPAVLKDILVYRRVFPNPELDRVRVIMPKSAGPRAPPESTENAAVSDQVPVIKLVGQKACVESASQALQSMIRDIKEQTTKEFPLTDPSQFIALDRARPQFRDLERQFRVFINLRRSTDGVGSSPQSSPDKKPNDVSVPPSGSLFITGRCERIDRVYDEEIRPMLPIEEEFALAQEFHRGLIVNSSNERQRGRAAPPAQPARGKRGAQPPETVAQQPSPNETQSKAAEIKQKYNVLIRLPPQQAVDADHVYIRGTPAQLASAKAELAEWIKHCEELKADRIARNFELSFPVPTRFVSSLVALRRQLEATHEVVMRFGPDLPLAKPDAIDAQQSEVTLNGHGSEADADTHDSNGDVDKAQPHQLGDVSVQLNGEVATDAKAEQESLGDVDGQLKPNDGSVPSVQERMTMVILRGYQHKAEAAKAELETTIQQLLAKVTEELCIPSEVHSQLIGSRGYAIHKVMQEFKVRIEFPNRNARETADANRVLVTGDPKDVDLACDYLIARANDLLDRLHSESRPAQSKQYREELLPSNGPALNA